MAPLPPSSRSPKRIPKGLAPEIDGPRTEKARDRSIDLSHGLCPRRQGAGGRKSRNSAASGRNGGIALSLPWDAASPWSRRCLRSSCWIRRQCAARRLFSHLTRATCCVPICRLIFPAFFVWLFLDASLTSSRLALGHRTPKTTSTARRSGCSRATSRCTGTRTASWTSGWSSTRRVGFLTTRPTSAVRALPHLHASGRGGRWPCFTNSSPHLNYPRDCWRWPAPRRCLAVPKPQLDFRGHIADDCDRRPRAVENYVRSGEDKIGNGQSLCYARMDKLNYDKCVFQIKMMNFVLKNKELCIKNKQLCIKNKEFCIKNDECLQVLPPVDAGHEARSAAAGDRHARLLRRAGGQDAEDRPQGGSVPEALLHVALLRGPGPAGPQPPARCDVCR